MRSRMLPVILILCCAVLCGCATMRYPNAYKVEGKEYKEFKELDDDRALKVVALIYNVKHETWEDGIARSIALDEYINLLSKRKSKYIRNSGIFDIKYDKVKLGSWSDEDLMKVYDALSPKAEEYYIDSAQGLTEIQNTERIVYITAVSAISKEIRKRSLTNKAMMAAGQVLVTALTVAMAMI